MKNKTQRSSVVAVFLLSIGFVTSVHSESLSSIQSAKLKEQQVIQDNESGAYQHLSSGNKKIANALYNAQYPIEEVLYGYFSETDKNWSHEEIASSYFVLNSWGQVFNQMKAENLVKEENLGQVIRNHSDMPKSVQNEEEEPVYFQPQKKEAIVITNGSGEYLVINRTFSKGPDHL